MQYSVSLPISYQLDIVLGAPHFTARVHTVQYLPENRTSAALTCCHKLALLLITTTYLRGNLFSSKHNIKYHARPPFIFLLHLETLAAQSLSPMSLDFNFQSLSLEDKSKAAAHADGRESLWRLDPDFTVQIDCVARLLVVEEITDAILESSGVLEIFSFRRTCRLGKRAVDSYNGRAFNVNRNLLRFFDDPESFRSLQERTNTLISGSFALALLDRTVYPESDLDLYTHPGFARVVSEWLHGEGYQLIRRGEEVDWEETVVDNWRNLTRPDQGQEDDAPDMEPYDSSFPEAHAVYNWNRDGRTVQIISCTRCPFAAILGFHSSQLPDLIASSIIYSSHI